MSNKKTFFTYNPTQSQSQRQRQQQQQSDEDDDEVLYFPDDSQEYANFRETYKRHSHVPLNCVDVVVNHHFPTESATIHEYDNSTRLLKVKISDLLSANVVNWEFNREPDFVRIPEIARYIYESKKTISTMLYVNYNFKRDSFELIDGTHRYKALQMISSLHRENGENIDPRLQDPDVSSTKVSWFTDTNIEWLMNMHIIVHVCFNTTLDDLINLRDNINCSQPMPINIRPGIDQTSIEKTNILNTIVKEYSQKYKRCFANSDNPSYLRSHKKTSADKFTSLLASLYDKYNININRVGTLKQKLEIANEIIRSRLLNNEIRCSKDVKDRCLETGCCLFIYDNDTLEELI
jgi:hypothetical protein